MKFKRGFIFSYEYDYSFKYFSYMLNEKKKIMKS
jgi:hypothetical protein